MTEHVHRAETGPLSAFAIGHSADGCNIHHDQRLCVEVRSDGDGMDLHLVDPFARQQCDRRVHRVPFAVEIVIGCDTDPTTLSCIQTSIAMP